MCVCMCGGVWVGVWVGVWGWGGGCAVTVLTHYLPVCVPPPPSDLMSAISFNKYQFPSYEDYKGVVTAIIRLQDTYLLPTHNLSQPEMAGVQAVKMTAKDCYDVGECSGHLTLQQPLISVQCTVCCIECV